MIVQAQALGINVTLKTLNNNLFAKPTSTFIIKASPFFTKSKIAQTYSTNLYSNKDPSLQRSITTFAQ
jgi:hypothetical protein